MTDASTTRERPVGVSVLAILLVLVGFLLAAPSLLIAGNQVATGNYLGALLTALFPQALIVGGLGLWFLQLWGVYVTVASLLYAGFLGTRLLLAGGGPPTVGVAAVAFALGALYYLTRPHVKAAVRARQAARAARFE